eukprot:27709_1
MELESSDPAIETSNSHESVAMSVSLIETSNSSVSIARLPSRFNVDAPRRTITPVSSISNVLKDSISNANDYQFTLNDAAEWLLKTGNIVSNDEIVKYLSEFEKQGLIEEGEEDHSYRISKSRGKRKRTSFDEALSDEEQTQPPQKRRRLN